MSEWHPAVCYLTHRAFFSKSPATTSKTNKQKSTETPPKTTPKKRKATPPSSANGHSSQSGAVVDSAESPVFKNKTKRRRVIVDSDESDNEGGVVCEGGDGVSGEDVKNTITSELKEDATNSQSNPSSKHSVQQKEVNEVSTTSNNEHTSPNNTVSTIDQPSTSTSIASTVPERVTSTTDTELLKTPPKRNTGELSLHFILFFSCWPRVETVTPTGVCFTKCSINCID